MIKYLPSHEYARVEGNIAYVGISPYAAAQLGNVVYVDMPEQGDDVTAGEDFGAIESVKAASDLFAPVSGAVIEASSRSILPKLPCPRPTLRLSATEPGIQNA